MDNVTSTHSEISEEETSFGSSSWDPKKFICDHNAEWPQVAEKIATLSKKQAELEKYLDDNEKKLSDIEHFYEEYGKKHVESMVTYKIDQYHYEKWDYQTYLEQDLVMVEDELLKNRRLLKEMEEDAKKVNCPCLKRKI